jgi:Lon protease-like protein
MSETLPLFPLGTVLFPGLVLPLHVFEQRYRQMVADLLEQDEPRQFGVIAIRTGRETGADGVTALYEIGCTAVLRQATRHEDGRYNLMTIGTQRFRLLDTDQSRDYLQGEVEMLAEDAGDQDAGQVAAAAVQSAFRSYLDALARRGAAQPSIPALPDEPVELSYLVAASVLADLGDRQALLAQPDALRRLAAERALLARETAMLRSLTAAPAPQLRHAPYNPN